MATVTDLNIGDAKNVRARSSFCTQVGILTKSVFRQKMINPKIGILEILMPLYPVLLVYIFKSVDVAKYEFTSTEAISFAPADSLLNNSYAEPLYPVVQWAAAPQNLYFAPDTVQSRSTASQICGKLGINSSLATWFQDGDALLKAGRIKNPEQDMPAEPRAGLILNPAENKFTLVHINDEYLNYYTNGVIAATDKKRARANAESIFVYNGFAVLQAAANEVMSDIPDNLLQTVKMESFDIPQTAEVQNGLKIILVLGFGSLYFMNLMNTLTSLGRDVEMGIKEALSLKGMQSAPYFLAKFFGDMVTIFVATLIAVPVSFGLGLFENANALLVFYILFLFGLGQTTFCLCVAISFGKSVKSKNLMMVGFMLFTVIQGLYFVVEFLMIEKDALPFFVQLTMLLFVVPFSHVLWRVSDMDLLGSTSYFEGPQNKYMASSLIFLVVDCILFFLICLLLDHFHENGGCKGNRDVAKGSRSEDSENDEEAEFRSGILIKNLVKSFVVKDQGGTCSKKKKELRAVDGLNLSIPAGQIFVLLGHNGAGKTTTIKTLSGTLMPTSGEAWVGGFNIVSDRDGLRKSIGVCPQFDILYDDLNCQEQLELFGKVHGLSPEEASGEAMRLLEIFQLKEKANKLTKTLSGGQKRRVSLAAAMIGSPRVLFLDEPTTGLDPRNRRNVWKLLQDLKKKKTTVILTTHSMEEADTLGDKIGVMSKGKLQACGTSLELKAKYGLGYHLHIVRTEKGQSNDVLRAEIKEKVDCDIEDISNIGQETSFSLPTSASPMFPDLFRHLDENRERLGIASFGLSATTLEEVFLNLAKEEEKEEEEGNDAKPEQTEEGQTRENVEENSGNTADDLEKGKNEGEGEEGKETEKGSSPENAFNLELPEYECKRNLCSQFTGIMSHVTLQGIRNPFGICYIVIWPVMMVLILGFIHLAIEKPASTPIELVPSLVDGEGTFIYDSPEAKDILGTRLAASSATTEKSIYEACRENSYDAVFNREWTDPTYDGGISLEDPSSTKEAQLFFNPKTEYSARVLLQQYYNANNNGTAAKCYYQAWPRDISQNDIVGGGLQFIIVSAFAIFGAFYCEDIVRVRISRVKDMLLLAGMSKGVFWLGYFIGHLILILITAVVVFPILRAFGFPGISSNSLLGYFFSLFCFAVANIFTGYLFGMFVKSIETAQNAVGEFYNTSVMVPWLIVTFGLKNPNKTLEMILSIIPGFGLYRCFAIMESASLNDEPFTSADVFKWDNDDKEILPTCLVMLGTGLVALLCILSIDYGLLDVIKLKFGCMRSADATVDSMDGIVAKDEEGLPKAISGEVEGGGYIHADTVAKSFQRKGEQPLRAVKGVSLDVKSGDLVGLLGPNGAGKTTFIHCLTGMQMVSMDKGDAFIGGKSVRTEMEQAREYMGICPQFDAISEYLTGREHLHLLARIRGIPSNLIKEVADAYILALDLGEKANAHAGTYSGGNKRKLSVAMSMIGRTTATFLDEPSTGMDPGTRRFMWNFLEKSREDKAILLTTHSMEEADALCNRIAIMTKGAIRAAGTPQELKENYGEGFLITVRRGGRVPATSEESDKGSEEGEEEQPKTIQELIHLISADARTSSDEFAVMKFVVPKEGVELASIFELMEKHRERLGVLAFSVSQTTLEDIFLHFAE